jgi:hypothetical protein
VANYRVITNTKNSNTTTQDKTNNKTKMNQLRLFTFKYGLQKLSVDLQTTFAAETHLAEGKWLKEQLNMLKHMFRVGT